MTSQGPARRYRFGAFEADVSTGELRRRGIRVKLNAQPFQMLTMLLERPGELLTREEICAALWPDGTFVDAEHGVNSAVNRIREALGDSAGSPRFVETLARRGYRFVAPVERIGEEEAEISVAEPEQGNAAATETVAATETGMRAMRGRILASPEDLPSVSYPVAQTLFVLMQVMYVGFYVGALGNLAEIEDLLSPLRDAGAVLVVLIVTAVALIPVRAFVICAVVFRAPGMREKFMKVWRFLLPLDELWALSPFLLLHHINLGLALACTALLVYSPFAQRSLVLMAAGGIAGEAHASAR